MLVDGFQPQVADGREAKARLDRIQEVMTQAVPDAAVADSLRNDIIGRLRSQYLEYDRRRAIYAERYGANHLAVVNLRTQMSQLQKSMSEELSRLAESYKSDLTPQPIQIGL